MNELPKEVESVLEADALECAQRASRYKFGRLSTKRIVGLLRSAAAQSGVNLQLSDTELVELWFARWDAYMLDLRSRKIA
jgi:hypothetical protein